MDCQHPSLYGLVCSKEIGFGIRWIITSNRFQYAYFLTPSRFMFTCFVILSCNYSNVFSTRPWMDQQSSVLYGTIKLSDMVMDVECRFYALEDSYKKLASFAYGWIITTNISFHWMHGIAYHFLKYQLQCECPWTIS